MVDSKDEIIRIARQDGRTLLTEIEFKQLISETGIEVVVTKLAKTTKEAASSMAKEIGFPVALRIVSPDIIHKMASANQKNTESIDGFLRSRNSISIQYLHTPTG